jgi:hypothetical protein
MTDEDRQIFQALLDAAVRPLMAAVQSLDGKVQSLDAKLDAAVQSLTTKQDRAVESIGVSLSEFREELASRMDTLERRFEVQAPVILSLDSRMTAFTRSLDQLIVAHHQTEDTLAAQRRFVDEIHARIKALEDRARGNQ